MRCLAAKLTVLLLAPAISLPAIADSLDGLEMDVIDSDEAPEAMMRRIELPEAARERDRERDRSPESDTAEEARERGADFGRDTAEQARERRGPPDEIGPPEGVPGDGRPNDDRPQPPEGADEQPGGGEGPAPPRP